MSARPSRPWRIGASRGIRVHCLALGGADLTSPAGQMTMTVINAVAQFERDLLVERTQSGLARARVQGKGIEICRL
ncbi:MAG: recombinase family protein [Aestuariivita sp.]|nr:recombinase family protein [Aestuariivita sp.]